MLNLKSSFTSCFFLMIVDIVVINNLSHQEMSECSSTAGDAAIPVYAWGHWGVENLWVWFVWCSALPSPAKVLWSGAPSHLLPGRTCNNRLWRMQRIFLWLQSRPVSRWWTPGLRINVIPLFFLCLSSHSPPSLWHKKSSTKGHLGNQQGHGCQRWETTPVQTLEMCAPGGDPPLAYWPFGSLLQTQPRCLQSQQQQGNIWKGFSLPEAARIISHLLNIVGALLSPRCKNKSRGFLLHTARKASALGMFQTRADNISSSSPASLSPSLSQPRLPVDISAFWPQLTIFLRCNISWERLTGPLADFPSNYAMQ